MRRLALAAAAALVALLVLLAVGRWERGRHADEENAGIARLYSDVGDLDNARLEGFRFLEQFQCLIYGDYDIELCVDWDGNVVEAIDRRCGEVRIWSLREDPERARVRVDRRRFERVIETMCADCRGIFERARAPLGQAR